VLYKGGVKMKGKCDLCGKETDDLKWAGSKSIAGTIRVCPECKILEVKVEEEIEREREKWEKQKLYIYLSILIPVGGILIVLAIVFLLMPPVMVYGGFFMGYYNVHMQYAIWLIIPGILFVILGLRGIGKIIKKRRK